MSLITDEKGKLFQPYAFSKENEFEETVKLLADQIFGLSSIYVDVKKKIAGGDIVTIPDGYVIDMTKPESPKLFIVENEIIGHDPFQHIGIQMLKFATSFDDARINIRKFLMYEISKDFNKLKRLEEGASLSKSRNIDNYLDKAVFGKFSGIVVIDEIRDELNKVIEKINANISVLELKTFQSEDGKRLYQFDTLYDEGEEYLNPIQKGKRNSEGRSIRLQRLADSDTVIVPARDDGFERVFLGKNQWYSIRISPAMKDKIKFIAVYRVSPISAVTHIAEVKDIRPYEDSGKYILYFKGSAKEIKPIKLKSTKNKPQGPVYVKKEKLMKAAYFEDALI